MWEEILKEKKALDKKIEDYKKEAQSKLGFKNKDRVVYNGVKCRITNITFNIETGMFECRIRRPRLSFSTRISSFKNGGDEELVKDLSLLKKVREIDYEEIIYTVHYMIQQSDSVKERSYLNDKIRRLYKSCTHYFEDAGGFLRFKDENTCPYCGVILDCKDNVKYPYLD